MQKAIFNIQNETDFERCALQVFKHQFQNNKVYRSFCDLLYIHPSDVKEVAQIPFLPIQFFKTHQVLSTNQSVQETFTSSGTTGALVSKHLVTDTSWYEASYTKAFEHFYGPIKDYTVLGLLPNYLEREGSSLIYMVNDFIQKSNNPKSGFYLDNLSELSKTLDSTRSTRRKSTVNWSYVCLVSSHRKSIFYIKKYGYHGNGGYERKT